MRVLKILVCIYLDSKWKTKDSRPQSVDREILHIN